MGSRYPLFDTGQLNILPLSERCHDLGLDCMMPLLPAAQPFPDLDIVAAKVRQAKNDKRSVVLMLGAHVLRSGVQKYLVDLIQRGFISCIAVNGACVIHDFEFSLIGATTESVARYIETGQFGLWRETGTINDIIVEAADNELGLGEAVGKYISEKKLPHRNFSLLAAAYEQNVPITAHVGIGYDIIHEHPNFNGAATGECSYRDFLIFTNHLQTLDSGVVMTFGSAVMAPEIFLKGLAMVRNSAARKNERIDNFTTLVCDLKPLPAEYRTEAKKDDPSYFFRPWKTMLVRTTSSTGNSYYVKGHHRQTIPALWSAIDSQERSS